MKFANIEQTIELKALPMKYSKAVYNAFQEFGNGLKDGPNKSEKITNDAVAAEFLMNQAYYLYSNVYVPKATEDRAYSITENRVYPQTLSFDSFSEHVTLDEVIKFLTEQVEICGKGDFLMQPLHSLLTQMNKMIDAIPAILDEALNKETDKALDVLKAESPKTD